MERRFSARLKELLDDATVKPAVLRDLLPRPERFVEPFAALLTTSQQGTPVAADRNSAPRPEKIRVTYF